MPRWELQIDFGVNTPNIEHLLGLIEASALNTPFVADKLAQARAELSALKAAIELPRVERPTEPGFYFAKHCATPDTWVVFKIVEERDPEQWEDVKVLRAYLAGPYECWVAFDELTDWRGPLQEPST